MAYAGVYVFGDSLVDAGNALKLAQWYGDLTFSDLPDGAPTSEKGYFDGRFSDGYTFADLLSNKAIGKVSDPTFPFGYVDPWLGVEIDPFEPEPDGNNLNWAYGGAQVRKGDEAGLDLDEQTDAFRDAVDGNAPSDALYIVTMGGNDVRNLSPVTGTPQLPVSGGYKALDAVAQQLIHELGQLIDDGARNFLITGIADVGFIPDYDIDNNDFLDASEQMRSQTATAYSQYLDMKIETVVVPALKAMGATVTYVSMMDGLDAILPTIEALNGLAPGTLTTDTVDNHQLLLNRELVFFDDIHPNAQVQALFGAYAQSILTNTPWIEILPVAGAEVDYGLTASIAAVGEVDKAVFALAAGIDYRFDMLGVSTLGTPGSLGDPSLRLLTSGGTVAGANEDSGAGFDAVLAFSPASAGTYTLEMRATGSLTGTYELQVSMGSAVSTAGQTYVVSNAAALVLEGAGWSGIDVVQASTSYALNAGAEIELLTTTNAKGKLAINLTGNEFGQDIIGNAGANVIDGKGGADTLTGGAGKDVFVLGGGTADRITDYERGEIVDISQVLSVTGGTNVVSSGYVRVTTTGLIQVDANGGGNDWVTLSSINGSGAVTLRYLSGGSLTTVSVNRVAETYALMAASAAAVGITTLADPERGSNFDHAIPDAGSHALAGQDSDGFMAAGISLDHMFAMPQSFEKAWSGATAESVHHTALVEHVPFEPAALATPHAGIALLEATEAPTLPVAFAETGIGAQVAPQTAMIIADVLGHGGGHDIGAMLDALPAQATLPGVAADIEVPVGLAGLTFMVAAPLMPVDMLAMHADAPAIV